MGNLETYFALLVRGSHTLLVNCGTPLDYLPWLNKRWGAGTNYRHQLVVNEEDYIENRLAAVGVKPDEVQHLIVTPLQPYALGGLDKFPKAQDLMSIVKVGQTYSLHVTNRTITIICRLAFHPTW